jgi:hypothetical protein
MKLRWLFAAVAVWTVTVVLPASNSQAAPWLPQEQQEEKEKKADAPQEEEPTTPEGKLEAWTKAYAEQNAEFQKAARAAKTPEERREVSKLMPKPQEFAEKFKKLADENPKSEAGLKALIWIAQNVRGGAASTEAIAQVLADYPEAKEIESVVPMLAMGNPSPDTETTLQQIIEKSPHDVVKAKATYALASALKRIVDLNGRLASDEKMEETFAKQMGEKTMDYVTKVGTDTTRIEELYQKIVDEYPDVEMGRRTLGKIASGALFEMRNLAIGKIAPEIVGKDFDEVEFKLSDYRGKVVVIDFWGDW